MCQDRGENDAALTNFRGVIFDWDGVLAATMEGNYRAWSEAFAPLGVKLPRQDYFLLEGMAAVEVARHFLVANKLDPSQAVDVKKRKEEFFLANNPLKLYPAAKEAIDRLETAGLSLALVTGASRTRLAGSGALEFLKGFTRIVSGDDVVKGKPDPESYLKALEGLQLGPEECLVVENAPLGIRAAKAAGIKVMALTTTLPAENLVEADWTLSGLEAFLEWFGRRQGFTSLERNRS